MKQFTYYCDTHREQTAQAGPPSIVWGTSGMNGMYPVCPVCEERMFWVPNAGTVIPAESRST